LLTTNQPTNPITYTTLLFLQSHLPSSTPFPCCLYFHCVIWSRRQPPLIATVYCVIAFFMCCFSCVVFRVLVFHVLVFHVLFWLCCFDCVVLIVLFWLCCFDCVVLIVLFRRQLVTLVLTSPG
jgi:hypothetical protein